MIFKEKQLTDGWVYETTDVFGTITITSDEKQLDKDELDMIVVGVLQSGAISGQITSNISFRFDRASEWVPEEKRAPKQCGVCGSFKTAAYPMLTFATGLILTAISFLFILFIPPLGIIMAALGIGVTIAGPAIMRMSDKGKTLYCFECRQETGQAA